MEHGFARIETDLHGYLTVEQTLNSSRSFRLIIKRFGLKEIAKIIIKPLRGF